MSIIYEYLPESVLEFMKTDLFGIQTGTWVTAVLCVTLMCVAFKITKNAIKVILFVAAIVFIATHIIDTYV